MTQLITMTNQEYEMLHHILERNCYKIIKEQDNGLQMFKFYTYRFAKEGYHDDIKVWLYKGTGRKENEKT